MISENKLPPQKKKVLIPNSGIVITYGGNFSVNKSVFYNTDKVKRTLEYMKRYKALSGSIKGSTKLNAELVNSSDIEDVNPSELALTD